MKRSVRERILEKLDVRAFYGEFAELSPASLRGECRGKCPLHEDSRPSFFVNVNNGSFKCFGCNAGGGPIEFYALYHKISVFEASAELLRRCGESVSPVRLGAGSGNGASAGSRSRRAQTVTATVVPMSAVSGKEEVSAVAAEIVAEAAEATAVGNAGTEEPEVGTSPDVKEAPASRLSGKDPSEDDREHRSPAPQASEIYQAVLEAGRPLSTKAIEYFASRSLRAETLERFGIAFIENPAAVEKELLEKSGSDALLSSGVFHKTKTGRARFLFYRHPLLFPLVRDGVPVWIQGRVFGDGTPKYCNLADVPVPCLFNIDRLKSVGDGSVVFVCEGVPDTMALEQAGFPAVGIVGCGGFKADWVAELARFRVHLVLDNDKAGRQGTEKIAGLFRERNLSVSVVPLPDGVKDVNEFFQQSGAGDFRNLVAAAQSHAPDFRAVVRRLLARVADPTDSFSYRTCGEQMYEWFESNGGVFLVAPGEKAYLMYERCLYEIGNNRPFNALMLELTDLVSLQYQAKMLWDVLASLCLRRGRRESPPGWTQANDDRTVLYINLHDQANRVARLGDRRVTIVENGSNPDGVMLRRADKMSAIDYDAKVNPREAVELFKRLVLDPLACEPENRLFLGSWILTAFLLDFTSEKGLLKLSGHTGSGKTTAARILSCLLYGEDHVESATVAYYYADAARNPYLICDNLETENMNTEVTQFLLHVATGVAKGKRKGGTDSETVREKASSLVAITAIEPLTKPELINRTYDIEFLAMFRRTGFMQHEHLQELVRRRSVILSGLFELFARELLPEIEARRREVLMRLESLYPRHAKQRTNSFLTLMIVILEALMRAMEPGRESVWDIVQWWIEYQGRLAEETERDTNVGLYLLDALAKEMTAQEEDFAKQYYFDFLKTVDECGDPVGLEFVASTRDILIALQVLAKNKGFKLPFCNTKQLGVRLANEAAVLEKAGWSREPDKIVHGMRFHKYVKRFA